MKLLQASQHRYAETPTPNAAAHPRPLAAGGCSRLLCGVTWASRSNIGGYSVNCLVGYAGEGHDVP